MCSEDTSANGDSLRSESARDLRERALFRTAILFGVLLVAFAATKSCTREDNKISQDEAVAIAKEHVDFTPDQSKVRYLPQGVPPVYYWAVFLATVKNGHPLRVQVVLVNATTGAVQEAALRPLAAPLPFRFEHFAIGDLHPASSSPYPWS